MGDTAGFRVHSTCPCNFTLYHEVMARGNLVHSGIHYAHHVQRRDVKFAVQDLITFEEDAVVAGEKWKTSSIDNSWSNIYLLAIIKHLYIMIFADHEVFVSRSACFV